MNSQKKPGAVMNSESDLLIPIDNISEQIAGAKSKLKVSIHKQKNALTDLQNEWEKLAEKSNQTICMSPEWVKCWWEQFGRHKKRSLHIITVHHKNRMVAILPFYKGITSLSGKIIEQRLQLIGSGGSLNEQFGFSDDYGITDFLDFIVDPQYREPVARLFISLLTTSELAAYTITFHQVRDDSFIKQYVHPQLIKKDLKIKTEHTATCPYIDVSETDTLRKFIRQKKSNARRRFRQTLRAEGDGNLYRIEEAKTPDDISGMVSTLIKLHQERWNAIGYPGAFHDERFTRFFKAIVFNAYKNKRLWIKQATDSNGVCAIRMALFYNGRYYDYMSGFDDNCPSAKRRPGIGLLLNLVEDSLTRKVKRIELLRGEEMYKYDFTGEIIKNWKISIPVLNQKKLYQAIPVTIVHACSFFYKYFIREKLLLTVQLKKPTLFKGLLGYFRFRTNSVLIKIKNR